LERAENFWSCLTRRRRIVFSSLHVMTQAVDSPDSAPVRACFARLRSLRYQLLQGAPDSMSFDDPADGHVL